MNRGMMNIIHKLNENFRIDSPEEDDIFEEENTTSNLDGGAGQIQTPYAFSKKVKYPDDPAYTEKVNHTDYFFKKWESTLAQQSEKMSSLNEVSYRNFKYDKTKNNKEKINSNLKEINKKLREVEQMVNHAHRLKNETGQDSSVFWKKTSNSFLEIKERLTRLSNKIVEITG